MRKLDVVDYTYGRRSSDDVNTSLPFAENFKECRTIQQANVVIGAYVNENYKELQNYNKKVQDLDEKMDTIESEFDSKQDTLVSGENIKTINNESILGEGNIDVVSDVSWGDITGDIDDQTDLANALSEKQDTLIGTETTGQNIKTINGESILGTGNITIQAGASAWGDITGDIDDQTDLANAISEKQDTLIGTGVGQNIKTINNNSILGSGNISAQTINGWTPAGSSYLLTYNNYDSSNKLLYLSVNVETRGFLTIGNKLRIENDNTFIYGIITEITANLITIYIGTQNYVSGTLTPTFDYSYVELPQGFPQYMSSLDKLYLPIEIPVGIRNNKPYYRICLSDSSTVSGDHNISVSGLSFDYIEIESFIIKSGQFILNSYGDQNSNDRARCFINSSSKNVIWSTGSSWATATFNCVLEYTKTTD